MEDLLLTAMERLDNFRQYIVFFLTVFILAGILLITAFFSIKHTTYLATDDSDTVAFTWTTALPGGTNACYIISNNRVISTGTDCYIYSSVQHSAASVVVYVTEDPHQKPYPAQLYLDYGDGYSEENSEITDYVPGSGYLLFHADPDRTIESFRLDIDYEYTLDRIEFHSSTVKEVTKSNFQFSGIIKALLWDLLICLVLFIIELFCGYVETAVDYLFNDQPDSRIYEFWLNLKR